MLNNWKECKLGDAITLQRGFDLPIQDREVGTVPIVSSSGISGTHSEAKITGPGVITGRYGTIGQVFYIKQNFWPLNTTLFVKEFKGNDPLFISYLLRTIDFNVFNDKSSVPGVNRNHLHSLNVRMPSLPSEQQAIARILGSLDDKIELNRQMNKTLEAIAQAVFKSWFIDFDPVRAKVEGREPYGMDAETAALFPDGFEDSRLGEIPRRWEVASLASEMEILSGGTPKTGTAEYWGGSIPWVSVVDTVPGPYIIKTEKMVTELGVENSAAKLLPSNTIVITARGTVGNCALLSGPMTMNQSCYGLRGKEHIGPLFLFYQVRSQIAHLKASAHGSVFDTITRNTFDNISVVHPEDKVLDKFEITMRPLFEQILNNQLQSQTLTDLRDTLLPKLISGLIRVKEAEKIVEVHV